MEEPNEKNLSFDVRFSVVKLGNDNYGAFFFLVDDAVYALVDDHIGTSDYSVLGSATINIELTAGQVVGIENIGSTTVYGGIGTLSSWFTGYLLYAF